MTIIEKYLHLHLQKLFPHFSRPLSSRFSMLFYELSKINIINSENSIKIDQKKKENQKKFLEKYRIYPEKILNGIEKRTSIIIKEIPGDYGAMNFYKLLTKFCNEINFFYIPDFAIEKWEYIYAFVTVGHRKGVLDIYEGLNLLKEKYKTFKGHDFTKIEVYFCRSQNIRGLKKKCQKETNKKNFCICK